MKTIDQKETQKKQQTNKQRQKRTSGNRSYCEKVRAESFCCAFKGTLMQI